MTPTATGTVVSINLLIELSNPKFNPEPRLDQGWLDLLENSH